MFASFGILSHMQLYLVRHGSYNTNGPTDSDPVLSEDGRRQASAAGMFLKKQSARPTLTVTSGYRRAQETADIILDTLGLPAERTVLTDFSPSGDPMTMKAILESLNAESVLVVGHMCSIGELARSLCPQAPYIFGTCTVVALEGLPGIGWKLRWFNDCGRI